MTTVTIHKKQLLRAGVALAAITGLLGVAIAAIGSPRDDEASAASAATGVEALDSATTPAPEAEAAAAHALGETMWFDHAEGREAWAERVKPLCTPNGWAFWAGPFFADQVWPTMMEQRYATQNIEMLDTQVVGEGEIPDSVIVEVSLNIEYVLGQDGQPEKQENTNRVVMVNQGGQWLMDGPPKQK